MIRDIMFAVMYGGVGIYIGLIVLGLVQKSVGSSLDGVRKLAAWIMCAGFLGLGAYHAMQYYRFNTPEGREVLRQMRESEGHVIIGPHQ